MKKLILTMAMILIAGNLNAVTLGDPRISSVSFDSGIISINMESSFPFDLFYSENLNNWNLLRSYSESFETVAFKTKPAGNYKFYKVEKRSMSVSEPTNNLLVSTALFGMIAFCGMIYRKRYIYS